MHEHELVVRRLYDALSRHDHATMAACYAEEATFRDIAFALRGKTAIHAMWHMICQGDIRPVLITVEADQVTGRATLVDHYTFGAQKDPCKAGRPVRNEVESRFAFREGLIVEHHDCCDPWRWAAQALGVPLGFVAGRVRFLRSKKAKDKLEAFVSRHPEHRRA